MTAFRTISEIKETLATTRRDNVHVSENGDIVNMLSSRQIRFFLQELGVSYDYIIMRAGDTVSSSEKGLVWESKSYNSGNPIIGVIISLTSSTPPMRRKMYIPVENMGVSNEDIENTKDEVGFFVSVALSRALRGTVYEFLDTPIIGTSPHEQRELREISDGMPPIAPDAPTIQQAVPPASIHENATKGGERKVSEKADEMFKLLLTPN